MPVHTGLDTAAASQWIFPVEAFRVTPSATTSQIPLERELYDRARGIEFLYRLGASLQLPTSALFTAATWYHQFYMRFSMEDFHRQDVATACIFLASKTDECGRKLRDVAKVCRSKATGIPPEKIPDEEAADYAEVILATEEVLLEALCFDLVVYSPHETLVDLIERYGSDLAKQYPNGEPNSSLCDIAWTIAHDSYRTVLCLLYDVRIIATACFILAQKYVDGEHSLSLDARIAPSAPSASLPTPPTNQPASPDPSRIVIEQSNFNEAELADLAETLTTLIDFYGAQDINGTMPHLLAMSKVQPPATPLSRIRLYAPNSQVPPAASVPVTKNDSQSGALSSHKIVGPAGVPTSPAKRGWKPISNEAVIKAA